MGKIIAFANQKGGVGKTTSAVNIAASVGILGKSVLLIDLDPQGNTTSGVGINKKNLKSTSYELLIDEIDAAQAIVETEFKNLSVFPSNISLAGAEFGVYVYSSEGKLTPWANPLLPSEPMRIRTGETETRFSLPQGTEFYLRQERAPEGYTFDSQTLIPVTDGEIVVQNKAQGRLNITVRDQRGDRRRSPDGDGRDGRANGIDDRWKRTSGAALRPRGKLHRFGNRAAGGRPSGAKRQRERAGGACIRRERRL